MPQRLTKQGAPPNLGESISPSGFAANRHSIGLGANGEPRGTRLLRPLNRWRWRCRLWRKAGNGGKWRRGLSSAVGSVWGIEGTPNQSEGGRGVGAGVEIRVPAPEFLSSSSAETPMSCEQGWETVETARGATLPESSSPNSRSNRPPRPMEGGGRWFPESGDRLPRANSAPQRATEGAKLRRGSPSKVLLLRLVAIPAHRQTRQCASRDGLGFSIGRRSFGLAPIENLRPFSDSGRRPASLE